MSEAKCVLKIEQHHEKGDTNDIIFKTEILMPPDWSDYENTQQKIYSVVSFLLRLAEICHFFFTRRHA